MFGYGGKQPLAILFFYIFLLSLSQYVTNYINIHLKLGLEALTLGVRLILRFKPLETSTILT